MQLKVKRLTETAVLPAKSHKTDAGFDICADEDLVINAGETATVSTGLAVAIEPGYYGRLKGRSGLTARSMLRVQEGTIDSDYRGEIKVICDLRAFTTITMNTGPVISGGYPIKRGERIAQLIIQPLPPVDLVEVDTLDDTSRGAGGFGSTGV